MTMDEKLSKIYNLCCEVLKEIDEKKEYSDEEDELFNEIANVKNAYQNL